MAKAGTKKLKIKAWFGKLPPGVFEYQVRLKVPEDITKEQANNSEYHERALIKAMYNLRRDLEDPGLKLDVSEIKFRKLWFDHYDEGSRIAIYDIFFRVSPEFEKAISDAWDQGIQNVVDDHNQQNPDDPVNYKPRKKK